jgi:phage terminase small subunit
MLETTTANTANTVRLYRARASAAVFDISQHRDHRRPFKNRYLERKAHFSLDSFDWMIYTSCMAKTPRKLTGKQELFCKEYLISKNATQAAIKSGYSPKTSHVMGAENLKKPKIKKRLAELSKPIHDKLDFGAKEVLAELKKLATSNLLDFFDENGFLKPLSEITRDQMACVSAVDMELFTPKEPGERLHISQAKKLKFWNKLKALELYGSHLSLFREDLLDVDEEPDEAYL